MRALARVRSARQLAALSGAAAAVSAATASSPAGQVVAHFHLGWDKAAEIVGVVATGGVAVDFLFPWLLPAVGTIQAIIAAAGTGAAIGW